MRGGISLDFDEADTESVSYDSESDYSSDEVSENESATKKPEGYWRPAEIDLPPKYSPAAVIKYTQEGSQASESSVSLRLHLLALGWKIEYKEEPQDARYRYTPPDGKPFYSLRKVCEHLMEHNTDCQNGSSKEEGKFVCWSSSPVMKMRSLRRSKAFIKPKYCPQAITYYCKLETRKGEFKKNHPNLDMRKVRLNAKRHLLHDGWHLRYVPKGKRQQLRYISPTKRSYISLVTACKSWMKKERNIHDFDKLTIGQDLQSNHSAQIVRSGFIRNFPSPNEPVGQETKEDGRIVLNVAVGSKKSLPCPSDKLEDSGILNSRKMSHSFPEQNDKLEDSGMLRSGKLSQSLPEQNDTAGERLLDCSSNQRMLRSGKLYKEFISQDKISTGASPLLRCGKVSKDLEDTQSGYSKQSTQPHNRQRQQSARLCSLIDNGVVFLGQQVWYRQNVDRSSMAEGKITREGIKCICCGETYTLSKFEAHAKSTKHRPAAHIFLKDGRSLLQCQMELGNHYKLPGKKINGAASIPNGDDQNDGSAPIPNGDDQTNCPTPIFNGDDICTICHFGGDLILCDHCPSCYHLSCIGLKELPKGEWFCPCCRCGICGEGEFDGDSEFSEKTVLFCDQCEREYHVGCLRESGMHGLDSCPKGNWFCSERCSKIFHHLCNLLGKSNSTSVQGLSWTILRSKGINDHIPPTTSDEDLIAFNKKICAALQAMNECFGRIEEPIRSRDLIADVLTNRRSDLNRLNFQGFYTMILEKGEEVVSVAAIRISGEEVAEIPLICTQFKYRQQGMCHLLMEELEKMLCYIGVERLFLPSIHEMLDIWRTAFGFTKLTASDRMAFSHHVFLEFQQTTMCQKLLIMPAKQTELTEGGNNEYARCAGVQEMDYEPSKVMELIVEN